MPPSDPDANLENLLADIAAGDPAALAELYGAVSPALFGLAVRLLQNRQLAEEVLQEVFLYIWQNAGAFSSARGSAMPWLFTLVHRRAVDCVRSTQADRRRDVVHGHRQAVSLDPEPADQVEAIVEGDALRTVLSRLSAPHRQVIELAYFGGHTQVEIAEILDTPLGTVKTRIRAALSRLRELHAPSPPALAA
ncbi:sigma-70 family RNA polymerase sigma factor [Microbacterium xanthum]|nr:sigma-70 family RNA polymerase sigma factor [Microbacterium sp. KSW-48]MDZ8170718.1 sigma-70 family RNA polymerase sigma factor [Microbacterium sp. KSW-48]